MIQEILHIQNAHQHLSLDEWSLIDREEKSLQAMVTRSITAYLYGAQMLVKSVKDHTRTVNSALIQKIFQPRQCPDGDKANQNNWKPKSSQIS
jgi:hypothetical protein